MGGRWIVIVCFVRMGLGSVGFMLRRRFLCTRGRFEEERIWGKGIVGEEEGCGWFWVGGRGRMSVFRKNEFGIFFSRGCFAVYSFLSFLRDVVYQNSNQFFNNRRGRPNLKVYLKGSYLLYLVRFRENPI